MKIKEDYKIHRTLIGGIDTNRTSNDFRLGCAVAGIKVDKPYFKGYYKGTNGPFTDMFTRLSEKLSIIRPIVVHVDLQEVEGQFCEVILLGTCEKDSPLIENILKDTRKYINWCVCI
ncbi:hypothetical protein EHV15_35610 [Paenibacillus oralis]|uniref:Uncharacterized protein n=1 Tax=Paenibacillus oralis TaxID=2490856 RepID=A0A3P3TA32_9BACL|nr:hypothetical protein [Paenibacillus oralis]RRJ54901.1 hypothetical protein EHV15_35610 [Paenibacillus oralis]